MVNTVSAKEMVEAEVVRRTIGIDHRWGGVDICDVDTARSIELGRHGGCLIEGDFVDRIRLVQPRPSGLSPGVLHEEHFICRRIP